MSKINTYLKGCRFEFQKITYKNDKNVCLWVSENKVMRYFRIVFDLHVYFCLYKDARHKHHSKYRL